MISFSIHIEKAERIKRFLSNSKPEYITVHIQPHSVFFIIGDNFIYSHLVFKYVSSKNITKPRTHRVPREKFLALLMDGFLEFRIYEESMEVKFKSVDGKERFVFNSDLESDFIDRYVYKLALLEEVKDYPRNDFEEIGGLVKIARSLSAPIQSCDGIVGVITKPVCIFQKENLPTFKVSANELGLLLNYSHELRCVENLLVHAEENEMITITKSSFSEMTEYDYIMKSKFKFKIHFKLDFMLHLCKKVKFSDGKFILDLENGVAKYIEDIGPRIYSTSVTVLDVLSSKSKSTGDNFENLNLNLDADSFDLGEALENGIYGIPKLLIPGDVLNKVLAHMHPDVHLFLYIQRYTIMIRIGKYIIVFSRCDYDE